MTDMYVAPDELKAQEPPPEASQLGAVVWLRKNLFNTVFNSILTVVLGVVAFLAIRGLLGWAFDEQRLWGVIPQNSTNYAVAGYPREELGRVWASVYVLAGLIGLSTAVWAPKGRMSLADLVSGLRATGASVAVLAALAPSSFSSRFVVLAAGVLLFLVAVAAGRYAGPDALEPRIPTTRVMLGGLVLAVAVVWLLPIASSTQVPITAAVAVAIAASLAGRALVGAVGADRLKPIIIGIWAVALPANWMHVQRAPIIPWETITGDWLVWLVVIILGGVGVLAFLSRANREVAGLTNSALVIASIGIWLFDTPMVARALLLLLTLFALATPTFGSGERGRRTITTGWLVAAAFATYLFALGVASAGLDTRNAYFGGFNLTVMLAVGALLLSIPLGLALALGRTSTMPLFRLMSTGYIEVVRGVPLITLLFFFRFGVLNFLPVGEQIDAIMLILVAMTMFSAAYLAENVRGGLQSIPKGQYEAAKALGMSTAQMTMLITLPQAIRAVIPALVGQVIALFKDTSLVAIIGLADFFRIARDVVPNQTSSLGSILENLFFAAAVYWIFTFTFSRASQRLERRLGVGTR